MKSVLIFLVMPFMLLAQIKKDNKKSSHPKNNRTKAYTSAVPPKLMQKCIHSTKRTYIRLPLITGGNPVGHY